MTQEVTNLLTYCLELLKNCHISSPVVLNISKRTEKSPPLLLCCFHFLKSLCQDQLFRLDNKIESFHEWYWHFKEPFPAEYAGFNMIRICYVDSNFSESAKFWAVNSQYYNFLRLSSFKEFLVHQVASLIGLLKKNWLLYKVSYKLNQWFA
jgi:hypothetical protein